MSDLYEGGTLAPYSGEYLGVKNKYSVGCSRTRTFIKGEVLTSYARNRKHRWIFVREIPEWFIKIDRNMEERIIRAYLSGYPLHIANVNEQLEREERSAKD